MLWYNQLSLQHVSQYLLCCMHGTYEKFAYQYEINVIVDEFKTSFFGFAFYSSIIFEFFTIFYIRDPTWPRFLSLELAKMTRLRIFSSGR